ncbi:MAG: hypothetical protein HOI06_04925 [Pelagibacteraceae bacterium]|jgi:hypothetical protein|nr:hypothetical protein [Flavobacteriaceae bacterium]MBT6198114.1 hypothetical protein [Pelagibacteraceae bacterium]MBT6354692.1 hypothetical protein [Pelagibacteraceae bacterium]
MIRNKIKFLTIITTVFFSFNILANNNLSGTKLFCYNPFDARSLLDESIIYALGFDFIDDENVKIIKIDYPNFNYLYSYLSNYHAIDLNIRVYAQDGLDQLDRNNMYDIDRKDLDIFYNYEKIYEGDNCKKLEVDNLFKYMQKTYDNHREDILKKNKI